MKGWIKWKDESNERMNQMKWWIKWNDELNERMKKRMNNLTRFPWVSLICTLWSTRSLSSLQRSITPDPTSSHSRSGFESSGSETTQNLIIRPFSVSPFSILERVLLRPFSAPRSNDIILLFLNLFIILFNLFEEFQSRVLKKIIYLLRQIWFVPKESTEI